MRRIFGSFLILLLNCTLLFGGCVSCPQFFMLPGAADCCKAGKCERSKQTPLKRDCKRMPLAHSGEQQRHGNIGGSHQKQQNRQLIDRPYGESNRDQRH